MKELTLSPVTGDSPIGLRPQWGVYGNLVRDFAQKSKTGDQKVVSGPNGEKLSRQDSRRVYQGLRQSVRYSARKGEHIPVEIHMSGGVVYLVRV